MRNSKLLVLLLTSLAFATGCSGSGGSAAAAPGAAGSSAQGSSHPISDPCKLLTRAEASSVVGKALVRTDVQHFGPITRCRFFDASGDEPIWLDVADAATFDALTHMPGMRPVSGIGDQALWQHDELSTFVHILKGGNMVSMGLPRTVSTLTPAIMKAAKQVAGRM